MRTKMTDCVGCTGMGLPCKGESCPNHGYYELIECDSCGTSEEIIYTDGASELCAKCMARKHKAEIISKYWDDIFESFGEDYVDDTFEALNDED